MTNHNVFNPSLQQNSMLTQEKMATCMEDVEQFMQRGMKTLMLEAEARLFADIYAICVPAKEKLKTQKAVRALRTRNWKNALAEAKGYELEALKKLAKIS